MNTRKLVLSAAIIAGCAALAGGASATTITFNGLAGANGSPFAAYAESGFTVTPTIGEWFQGQAFGNPAPNIVAGGVFGGPADDSIGVTAGGGRFTFTGLDFAPSPVGNVDYTFTGTLGGSPVFSVSGVLTPPQTFETIASGVAGDVIDDLVVAVTLTDNTPNASVNIDNIVLNPAVPEPAAFGLLAAGLGLLGMVRLARRG